MHYDLGIFHRLAQQVITRVNLYYIDVENYIVANSGDVYHTAAAYGYNLDQISFYGVELELDSTWFEKLNVFGNYTYRETDYDAKDLLADAILLTLAPKHKVNVGIRYRLFPDTLLTSDVRYMGKRESEGDIHTLDDFITVDMGVEQKLFKNTTLRVYATNIFGENYEEVYGFQMPGVVLGVNLKLALF
jgi:outer membrane receptor protein involved in Fe transport